MRTNIFLMIILWAACAVTPAQIVADRVDNQLYPIIVERKVGFINTDGNIAIKPRFDMAGHRNGFNDGYAKFAEGLAVVAMNGKMGFIDVTGTYVIEPQFFDAHPFSEGLAEVRVDDGSQFGGKWGYIDQSGKFVIEPRFIWAEPFHGGVAIGRDAERTGYIDRSGRPFLPTLQNAPRTAQYRPFIDDRAWLGDGDETVLMTRDGCRIKTPAIENQHEFSEGLAGVMIKDKWGFIDKDGRVVIAPRFKDYRSGDDIGDFSEGLARISQTFRSGYIDRRGRVVIPIKFDEQAGDFHEGLAAVSINDKYGFIDKRGRWVIPPRYRFVSSFHHGIASVDTGKEVGFINSKGRFVIKPTLHFPAGFDGPLAFQTIRRRASAAECADDDWGYIDRSGSFVWRTKTGGSCDQ